MHQGPSSKPNMLRKGAFIWTEPDVVVYHWRNVSSCESDWLCCQVLAGRPIRGSNCPYWVSIFISPMAVVKKCINSTPRGAPKDCSKMYYPETATICQEKNLFFHILCEILLKWQSLSCHSIRWMTVSHNFQDRRCPILIQRWLTKT